ncbi:hypothetical protein DXG01_017011 [Tephrocybe rancida]|nr:hypothetical protein DXG01_017011 [Tephrocybe rancida]
MKLFALAAFAIYLMALPLIDARPSSDYLSTRQAATVQMMGQAVKGMGISKRKFKENVLTRALELESRKAQDCVGVMSRADDGHSDHASSRGGIVPHRPTRTPRGHRTPPPAGESLANPRMLKRRKTPSLAPPAFMANSKSSSPQFMVHIK